MKRVLQTDNGLSPTYNRYGCLYRDVIAIAEEEAGVAFEVATLRNWEVQHRNAGLINMSMGLHNERSYVGILSDAFGKFGIKAGGNQAGLVMRNGEFKWWGGDPIQWHYMLVNFETRHSDGHWLLCDAYGGELFNPDPEVQIGKRQEIFFVKLWGV